MNILFLIASFNFVCNLFFCSTSVIFYRLLKKKLKITVYNSGTCLQGFHQWSKKYNVFSLLHGTAKLFKYSTNYSRIQIPKIISNKK